MLDNVIDAWEYFKSIFMSAVNNISRVKKLELNKELRHRLMLKFCSQLRKKDNALKHSNVTNLSKSFPFPRFVKQNTDFNLQC